MAEAAVAKAAAIFVGDKVAGAAISFFVKRALGRLTAEDEHLRQKLMDKLPVIQAIFGAGDHEQVTEILGDWLFKFRDAMEEAEDAFDELEFLDLEKEVKDRRAKAAKDWKERVSSRLPDIPLGFRRSISAVVTGGTSKRLKDALRSLDSVLSNAGSFLSIVRNSRHHGCFSSNQHLGNTRETTRGLTTEVFGRGKEKNEILEWLGVNTPNDNVDHKLLVCAVVGAGGMGKTTLAQWICQDKMVQDHFGNMIIWVHVSKRFDPKVLVRRILESITPDKVSVEALDSLQLRLKKELVLQRFLLVLDDAWEDTKDTKWEEFLGSLRENAAMGGRILLTTRMRSVAEAIKCQMQIEVKCLELTGLDRRATLELFNHHAFDASIPCDRHALESIGVQIAEKLRGYPFAAKVLGQQLRGNTDHSWWTAILNHNIQQVDDILELSYQNLSYEVQLCFRYCSLFPPMFKFKMEELTKMWVGSGLILQRENGIKNQDDIAREHFGVLTQKSFFSLVPRELNSDPSEDYYVMHPIMHKLACSMSSEESSRYKHGDLSADIDRISPPKVRHLYIQSINSEIITIISQSKNLRTLIIAPDPEKATEPICGPSANSLQKDLMHDLKKAIKARTRLRLLKLDGYDWFGMNDVVSELKHLRYIYMSATDEPNLSKLFKLYHLQFLQILKIDKEERVSSIDICNLPSLKKLDLPKTTLSRIPYIGRMTNLRELNGFGVQKKDGYRITELQDLRKLQKIIVFDVQNIGNCNEADSANLDNKTDMKVLSLGWSEDQARVDYQIIHKLVPQRNLKHLTISGYNGIRPPMWIGTQHLSNLIRLELDGCVEWDELPQLGSLRSLKHVFLANLPKLKYIASSSRSRGCDAYAYRADQSKSSRPGGLPPHLFTFVVKDCPNLSRLPDLPFSLQFLEISSVGISSLPAMSDLKRLEPQLSTLNIQSCEFLIYLNGCFLQEDHYRALTVLKLFQCHALRSLPDEGFFQRISRMEIVEILECNSLSSLGGIGALSCLKVLKIEGCSKLVTASSSRPPPASVEHYYLKLDTLAIDDHQLLVSSSLRNLSLTRRLIISGGSKMSLLPEEWLLQNSHMEHIEISNADLMQSLPLKMNDLCNLRSLLLRKAPVLQSLPLMPPKLWVLIINGCCTELTKRCQCGGSDWAKISQIPHLHISDNIDMQQLPGIMPLCS